jgi:hypothetical protein
VSEHLAAPTSCRGSRVCFLGRVRLVSERPVTVPYRLHGLSSSGNRFLARLCSVEKGPDLGLHSAGDAFLPVSSLESGCPQRGSVPAGRGLTARTGGPSGRSGRSSFARPVGGQRAHGADRVVNPSSWLGCSVCRAGMSGVFRAGRVPERLFGRDRASGLALPGVRGGRRFPSARAPGS